MSRKSLIGVILILLPLNVSFALTMSDTIQQFEQAVSEYDNGDISVAQLIIKLEHYKDENNNYLKENDLSGWNKTEVEKALSAYKTSYGYVMQANDLNVFMGSYNKLSDYYGFGYSVGGRKYTEAYYENELPNDILSLKESIQNAYTTSNPDMNGLGREFVDTLGPIYKLSYDECVDLMSDLMTELTDEGMPEYVKNKGGYYYIEPPEGGRLFGTVIHEQSKADCMQECWYDNDCEQICNNYPNKLLLTGYCSQKGNYLSISREGFSNDFFNFVNSVSTARQSTPFIKECEPYHYNGILRFREQLQESLNDEFFDWYINDFLGDDINKHLKAGAGFERLMKFFEENEMTVANSLDCKDETDWPAEFKEIELDYQEGNIEFHVWEELIPVSGKSVDTWTTFYKYKLMPDKDMVKQLINHQLSQQSSFEPSESEKKEIKSHEEILKIIKMLTNGFGESLDFQLTLQDEGEELIHKYVSVNDNVILRISDEPSIDESIEELTKSINEKRSSKRSAQAEFRSMRTSLRYAKMKLLQNRRNKDKVSDIESQISQSYEKMKTLRNKVSELDSQIASLQSELDSLENESFQSDFNVTLNFDNVYGLMNRIASIDGKTVKGPSWANPESRTPLMIGERIGLLFDFWNNVKINPFLTKLRLFTRIERVLNYLKSIQGVESSEETKALSEIESEYESSVQSKAVSNETTSGDDISFKVELSYGGSTTIEEFKARNLNSETPDFRINMLDGSETIILGSEQKGWHSYETTGGAWEWESVSGLYPSWSVIWDNYYTNTFLPYYNLTLQATGGEYTAGDETGSVRVYDINKNPNLADSVFQAPN